MNTKTLRTLIILLGLLGIGVPCLGVALASGGGGTCYGVHKERFNFATGQWEKIPFTFTCDGSCPPYMGSSQYCSKKDLLGDGFWWCGCRTNAGWNALSFDLAYPGGSPHYACDDLGHANPFGLFDTTKCADETPCTEGTCVPNPMGGQWGLSSRFPRRPPPSPKTPRSP